MNTASAVIGIISGLIAIVRFFIDYAEKRQLADAITIQLLNKAMEDSDSAIAKAMEARKAAADRNTRDPDSILRDDDGWKRPGD